MREPHKIIAPLAFYLDACDMPHHRSDAIRMAWARTHPVLLFVVLDAMLLTAVVCLPIYLTPAGFETFKRRATIMLAMPKICGQNLLCRDTVARSLQDPHMSVTEFAGAGMLYVRPLVAAKAEHAILWLLNSWPVRACITWARGASAPDAEFWRAWTEAMHMSIAMAHSVLFRIVLSLTVSKVWVYFVLALASSLSPWGSVATVLKALDESGVC